MSALLKPALRHMLANRTTTRPARYENDEVFIAAVERLVEAQAKLLAQGTRQTLQRLWSAAGTTPDELTQIFDAIDWPTLCDELRFSDSRRGPLPLADSTLILKTATKPLAGGNVFAVNSPAYPTCVLRALEEIGQPPEKVPAPNTPGVEASAYIVEMTKDWSMALRVAALPEGTHFDPATYPKAVHDHVARELHVQAAGPYEVKTSTIVREELLGPVFRAAGAHGRNAELPLRVESGWIRTGPRAQSYRFLGAELDFLLAVRKMGGTPFLDMPRILVRERAHRKRLDHVRPRGASISGTSCSFLTHDGRELIGEELQWAASAIFGKTARVPEQLRGIFREVAATTIELAGANPAKVDYAVADMLVGRPGAGRTGRMPIGLLMRDEQGEMTSGWGAPGLTLADELVQRELIADAETHVARMRPGGRFDQAVSYLQAAGVQSMGLELRVRRIQREGLILATDIFLTRASLHV